MPTEAETTQERGFGPFVTFVVRERPDGVIAHWESRSHRKHLSGASTRGSTWWAPQDRDWWIGVLFAIGSFLFGLGTVPAYADAVGGRPDAVTFFIGSLFFTSAGFLQYREAVDAAPRAAGYRPPEGLRVPAWPDRLARDRRAVDWHHRVQRQHIRRHLGGASAPRRHSIMSGAPTSSAQSASWSRVRSRGSRRATAGRHGGRARWPGGSPG